MSNQPTPWERVRDQIAKADVHTPTHKCLEALAEAGSASHQEAVRRFDTLEQTLDGVGKEIRGTSSDIRHAVGRLDKTDRSVAYYDELTQQLQTQLKQVVDAMAGSELIPDSGLVAQVTRLNKAVEALNRQMANDTARNSGYWVLLEVIHKLWPIIIPIMLGLLWYIQQTQGAS